MNFLLIHSCLLFSSIFDVILSFLKPVFEADKPNVTNRTGWSKAREILSLVQSKQEQRRERGKIKKKIAAVFFLSRHVFISLTALQTISKTDDVRVD
jgi:hypothetical protein